MNTDGVFCKNRLDNVNVSTDADTNKDYDATKPVRRYSQATWREDVETQRDDENQIDYKVADSRHKKERFTNELGLEDTKTSEICFQQENIGLSSETKTESSNDKIIFPDLDTDGAEPIKQRTDS